VSRTLAAVFAIALSCAVPAAAQFTGPSAAGDAMTVASANDAPFGSYVAVTGRIVEHLREDYHRFADETGEIRVEIPEERWRGRAVTPETRLWLVGEIDPYRGGRYLWVESLDVVD